MRTTLTLDEDVATELKAEARRTGRPFREVVNEALRRGSASGRARMPRENFKVKNRDLGNLRPGLTLDNVAQLMEQIKGSLHR